VRVNRRDGHYRRNSPGPHPAELFAPGKRVSGCLAARGWSRDIPYGVLSREDANLVRIVNGSGGVSQP